MEEKLWIAAETEQPGACFAEIARRYDVSRGLLWNWRSQVRWGILVACPPASFLPVHVMGDASGGALQTASEAPRPRDKRPDTASQIDIDFPDGTVVRVGSDVSAATLRRVLAAARGICFWESGRGSASSRELVLALKPTLAAAVCRDWVRQRIICNLPCRSVMRVPGTGVPPKNGGESLAARQSVTELQAGPLGDRADRPDRRGTI